VQLKNGTRAGAGRASFSGNVGMASPWPVDLSGDFRDFDPDQLVAMPPALLNGKWRVAGRIGGLPTARAASDDRGLIQADIALDQSRCRNLPLAGSVAATLAFRNSEPQRLSAVKAALRSGSGTVDASGALGEAADT